eukprot:symbB.v1.2.023354.t1/scaffold2127.1/size88416/7
MGAADVMRRVLQVALGNSTDGPLMEHLADLFMLCTTVTALMATAQDLIVGITDHVVRTLVLQSFEKLNAQHSTSKTHFLSFIAEIRALSDFSMSKGTLIFHQLAAREAAEVVSDMVARQSVSIQEVALATRDAILATGWAPEHPVAIARMAASAAAKAAGWQEVAQAASDAARAAWLPSDEVPRVAAESASLEVAKDAVLHRKTGEEVGLAVKATIRAAGVPTSFIPVIASKALASALSDCHQEYLGYRPEDAGA